MVKKSFRDTLSPRGVCSRIPHPGVCTPQHVPFLVHAYAAYYTISGVFKVIGCGREYWFALLKTVFFRWVRRYAFIRSHRPHAAPSKYNPFLKVVLVWVCCILYHFPSLHVLLGYNHFVYFVVQIFEHTSVGWTQSFLAILWDHMVNTGFSRSSMERLPGLSPHRLAAVSPAA